MIHETLAPGIEIYNADCLDVMREMEDGSVDAVITDPPYGNSTEYGVYIDTKDNLRQLVSAFMPQATRIGKSVFVTSGVANMWLYPEPTWTLSWVNPAGVGSSSWGFTCWQPILAYGRDPYLQDGKGRRPDTLFQMKTDKDKNDHPCAKPDNVMRWIIERTTREDDLILDPFMGSGTTGVACVKEGRKFIGIEIDESYYAIAKRRIQEALMQPRLL
jgi:site-specific DNA-methyltransferase (adenine-specific)